FWFAEYNLSFEFAYNPDWDPGDSSGVGVFEPVAFAAAEAAVSTLCADAWHAAGFTARFAAEAMRGEAGRDAERAAQCRLSRDLFGDVFRRVPPDPGWLTADVRGLARATYQERALPSGALDPARLAVLADALEDAGC